MKYKRTAWSTVSVPKISIVEAESKEEAKEQESYHGYPNFNDAHWENSNDEIEVEEFEPKVDPILIKQTIEIDDLLEEQEEIIRLKKVKA